MNDKLSINNIIIMADDIQVALVRQSSPQSHTNPHTNPQMGKLLVRGFSTASFPSLVRERKVSDVSETTNLISNNENFSWSNTSELRIEPYHVVEEADTVLPHEILPRIEACDADRIWALNHNEGAIYLEVKEIQFILMIIWTESFSRRDRD